MKSHYEVERPVSLLCLSEEGVTVVAKLCRVTRLDVIEDGPRVCLLKADMDLADDPG